jgi:hypothetical protein
VEYPSTVEQAWMLDSEHVFAPQVVQLRLTEAFKTAGQLGTVVPAYIDEEDFLNSRAEFSPGPSGPLTVYEFPVVGRSYVVGADVGSGAATAKEGDPSAADVTDVTTGIQVAHLHMIAEPQSYALYLYALGVYYNHAMLAVETTGGHGLAVVNWLRDARYYNLFRRRVADRWNGGFTTVLGWNTSKKTKEFLIDMLRADFVSGAIGVNHLPTLREMSTYVYTKSRISGVRRMAAQGQAKDDRVISLALANAARRDAAGITSFGEEPSSPAPAEEEPPAQEEESPRIALRRRMLNAADSADFY